MDVSIAVSLIRGQMGAVVERAVNGAVEMVLAEMLKVVGVKFEELKAQVALMKKDIMALQREKAMKEKENDNIRAKLRYTELKLKYYRQGVEEELQQRASAATLVRIHPSTHHHTHRGGAGATSVEDSPSCSAQTRTAEGPMKRSSEESTSPHSTSGRLIRVRYHSDAEVASSDQSNPLQPLSYSVNAPTECVDSSPEQDTGQSKAGEQESDYEWIITVQPHADTSDMFSAPLPIQTLMVDSREEQVAGPSSADQCSSQADSSTLPQSVLQMTQHTLKQEVEEAEVTICIKEEPEDEHLFAATLLPDCQVQQQQRHLPESEAQSSVTGRIAPPAGQTDHCTVFTSAGQSTYAMPQQAASLLSMVSLPPGVMSRQAARPWSKDLSLYEEYKKRRNELRRRNLSRRRELEKTLPQPLLADLVRERREKTRLRVARWRAKRKLQACLNQAQALGGAASLSQIDFPNSSQHQQPRMPYTADSSQQSQSLVVPQSSSFLGNMSAANSMSNTLPSIPSSSSSSVLLSGPSMAMHQHTVTSLSSDYPQLAQHRAPLTDADVLSLDV